MIPKTETNRFGKRSRIIPPELFTDGYSSKRLNLISGIEYAKLPFFYRESALFTTLLLSLLENNRAAKPVFDLLPHKEKGNPKSDTINIVEPSSGKVIKIGANRQGFFYFQLLDGSSPEAIVHSEKKVEQDTATVHSVLENLQMTIGCEDLCVETSVDRTAVILTKTDHHHPVPIASSSRGEITGLIFQLNSIKWYRYLNGSINFLVNGPSHSRDQV